MEGGHFWRSSSYRYENLEKDDKELDQSSTLPSLPQPQTPKEPMESMQFLSRSWSLSAAEFSKAFAQKPKLFTLEKRNSCLTPESLIPQLPPRVMNLSRRLKPSGKWFLHRDSIMRSTKKKDKIRAENARTHAALCVAGLATALAAVTATEDKNLGGSKMSAALASAMELLASHCIELAESTGADRDSVVSVIRSAVDIQSPSDLATLTAAAATGFSGQSSSTASVTLERSTLELILKIEHVPGEISPGDHPQFHEQLRKKKKAFCAQEFLYWNSGPSCPIALRGEAALKARFLKEARKNSTVIPYEKGMGEGHMLETTEWQHQPIGDLLQHVHKGELQWKHVSIYINKKSQVIIKLKSKHVGGAFSKKNKGVVYGVCDEKASWPFRKEGENAESYFGVKTAKGLLEFKCKTKLQKQRWVQTIQNLLQRNRKVDGTEQPMNSFKYLTDIFDSSRNGRA